MWSDDTASGCVSAGTAPFASAEQFAALARGGGDQDAIGQLVAAQRSKHVFLLSKVAELAARRSPDDALGVAGCQLLAQVQQQDPAAAAEVTGYPSVGAWAPHVILSSPEPGADSASADTASVGAPLPGVRPSGLAAVAAAPPSGPGWTPRSRCPVLDAGVLPSLGTAKAVGPTAIVASRDPEVRSRNLGCGRVNLADWNSGGPRPGR